MTGKHRKVADLDTGMDIILAPHHVNNPEPGRFTVVPRIELFRLQARVNIQFTLVQAFDTADEAQQFISAGGFKR